MTSIERTAYPRFNRAVPVRELHEAFTPAAGEIAWAREQTRTPEHLLALVVLLKSCHRLGYFPVLAEVSPPRPGHHQPLRHHRHPPLRRLGARLTPPAETADGHLALAPSGGQERRPA